MKRIIRSNISKILIVLIMIGCNIITASGGDVNNVMRTYGLTENNRTTVFVETIAYRDDMPHNVVELEIESPLGSEIIDVHSIQQAIDYKEDLEEQERKIQEQLEHERMLEEIRKVEEAERERIEMERRKQEEKRIAKINYINNINKPTYVNETSNLSLEHMREILSKTGLQGTEYAFYKLDQQGINFFFAVAVSIQEAGWKTNSYRANSRNDVFGITSVNRYYKSKQECIYYFGDFITRLYLNKGLTTVESINKKYCPGDGGYWSNGVRGVMNKLHSIAMDTIPN